MAVVRVSNENVVEVPYLSGYLEVENTIYISIGRNGGWRW